MGPCFPGRVPPVTAGAPSTTRVVLARIALALMVALVLLGLLWHGLSVEVLDRIWHNLLDRPTGPMTFRFVLQPLVAAIEAVVDGRRDALEGRPFYLRALLTEPSRRARLAGEGLRATARVLLLGLAIDALYQVLVFDSFHPAEAVLVALLLAFLPYLLLRGPAARVARRFRGA